jgi:hypothetical protein
MKRSHILCVFAMLAGVASTARGAVLFERSLVVDRSANIFSTDVFDLEFVFSDTFFAPTSTVKLFDSLQITPASVGLVYEAASGVDPNFDAVANRMTDGLNQIVRVILTETASGRAEGRGGSESGFFQGLTPGPDFVGATIDAIRVRVDGFRLLAGAPIVVPPVELNLTLTVLGTAIPEPQSLALAGVGLAAAAAMAYTRRRTAA